MRIPERTGTPFALVTALLAIAGTLALNPA
jgi:hypothetical protein